MAVICFVFCVCVSAFGLVESEYRDRSFGWRLCRYTWSMDGSMNVGRHDFGVVLLLALEVGCTAKESVLALFKVPVCLSTRSAGAGMPC